MPVINKYHHGNKVPDGAINIMRGSIFGNPYSVEEYGREKCIPMFRVYLWKKMQADKVFAEKVKALHGKTLCCCCYPKPCHGDVLLNAARYLKEKDHVKDNI